MSASLIAHFRRCNRLSGAFKQQTLNQNRLSFHGLQIVWVAVNPKVAWAPVERLSEQILVNKKLANDTPG